VVYSYPKTLLPSWDENQIAATRNAAKLGIPIFVIGASPVERGKKRVRLGWVVELDDRAGQVLINFGEEPAHPPAQPADEDPFLATVSRAAGTAETRRRVGQGRFRYQVLGRYGPTCMLCGMRVTELLETPHIVPYANHGTNDPRNGVVMCSTHHRAFDADFFAIEPASMALRFAPAAPSAGDLRITESGLPRTGPQPHADAVKWRWAGWLNRLRIRPEQTRAMG